MRYAHSIALLGVVLLAAACSSNNSSDKASNRNASSDAGATIHSGHAGTLEHPSLPRPPKSGLPDDLKPPR